MHNKKHEKYISAIKNVKYYFLIEDDINEASVQNILLKMHDEKNNYSGKNYLLQRIFF